ncbi:hypothetical protein C8R48DRAFT_675556 [Suillus tomentosus]|nr:hypothetical protein C8R48DRAFT_675556 [Suillus tomentosus]
MWMWMCRGAGIQMGTGDMDRTSKGPDEAWEYYRMHKNLNSKTIMKHANIPHAKAIRSFQANAMRRPPTRPAPHRVPQGFFDNVQDSGPSSTTHPDPSLHRLRNAFALSWGSRPRALLAGLPSLFHHSQPNTDEHVELQQRPLGPGTSSRRSPPIVDVPALDDKKALYVARPPERASNKAKRVDKSKCG